MLDKRGLAPSAIVPLVIFGAAVTLSVLHLAGIIDVSGFLDPNSGRYLDVRGIFDSNARVYDIPDEAKIGVPYEHDFAEEFIPLLGPQSGSKIYSFYLGSGIGFPPMGLILDMNGKLKGTPTGTGGKFQVCVKDSGGRSACRNYHLNVNPAKSPATNPNTTKCPATSCDTGSCCTDREYDPSIGTYAQTAAVLTHDYCDCPSDTTYYSTDSKSPGGPWKVCTCNNI